VTPPCPPAPAPSGSYAPASMISPGQT